MHDGKTIYRVAVTGLTCRSSRELLNLSLSRVPGVEATAIDENDVLTVFADAELVRESDVVRTIISTGFLPGGDVEESDVEVHVAFVVDAPRDRAEEPTAEPPVELPADAATEASAERAEEALARQGCEAAVEEVAEPVFASVAAEAREELRAAEAGLPAPRPSEARGSVDAVEVPAADVSEQSFQKAFEAPITHSSPRASLVQRIKVEVSDNYYPNRIDVIPGVPVEIEFSEGHGCLAHVLFEDFGIDQELTEGGAVVRLPGLAAGEYQFSCGMHMVFGKVVAQD